MQYQYINFILKNSLTNKIIVHILTHHKNYCQAMLNNNTCEECKDYKLKMEKKLDYPER
jgi:hypothetical protein